MNLDYWRKLKKFSSSVLVFKNNFSLFCHINQNFNVLLYKSFNKFPSDTKITIMLHRRTHTYYMDTCTRTHANTHAGTHAHIHTKQNAPFLIWHFGHMEQFALICWFGWPCSAIIAMFVEWHPFPLSGPHSPTQGPGYKYSSHETTSTCTHHMNTGTHTVMAGICKC